MPVWNVCHMVACVIYFSDSVDPNMTVGDLFADGSIEITVVDVYGLQARIGVEAPAELDILRDELCES